MPRYKPRLSPEERQQRITRRRLARAERWRWLPPAARDAMIHEAILHLCNYKEAVAEVEKYNYGRRETAPPPPYREERTAEIDDPEED